MKDTMRYGLTLVEVLIAMLIFAVGVLGLAASSASLARQIAWNSDRSRASSLARSRFETLSASPCASAAGTDRSRGVTSQWITVTRPSFETIDETATRLDSRGLHVDALHGGVPCN